MTDRAWDPELGHVRERLLVLVSPESGRIVAVDRSGAPPPAGATVLDAGPGATLLPGLIDGHVHLSFDPDDDVLRQMAADEDDALLAVATTGTRRALVAGVTTMRDLGDRNYVTLSLRETLRARPGDGPELLVAGPPLTPTRGHCWFLGGEADGIAGLERAVAHHVVRGVDVVKIMATGGMLTPGRGLHESQYNRAELRAATEAAHDAGLPVTAHAHGGAGIADALAAAVDGIEHATFVTEDAVGYDEDTVDRIAAAGVVVSATEAWLPSDVPFPPAAAHRLETVWQNFLRMHDAGVRLAVSSDAGVGPRKPHDVLPYGAVLFGDLGLSSHAVLTAVTATPAAACGVGDRKARLAAGYDADLLIVEGDPISDLRALLRPRAVVRAGHVVPR